MAATVDLAQALGDFGNGKADRVELQALQAAVDALRRALAAETQARQDAVAGEGQARAQGDQAEGQARAAGDVAQGEARALAIGQEVKDRNTAIGALGQRLDTALGNVDAALRGLIAGEAGKRADAIDGLSRDLTAADAAQARALQAATAAHDKALVDAGLAQARALADLAASIRAVTDALSATAEARRFEFVAQAGRPGDAPPRYTLVAKVAALAGPRSALPALPSGLIVDSDSGPVARIAGSGILAARAAFPCEVGRMYRIRYVIQRRANPSNPSGDATVCGVAYLDQSLRLIGDVIPVRTYPALMTADGRQECEVLLSRSPGLGAAFQAPQNARFMVPVLSLYGSDAATDVEVLSIEDVTGAFVLPPPVVDFEARLARMEAADIENRLRAVESAAGTAGSVQFKSKGDAEHGQIPDSVQVVVLLGRKFAGDGGGGRYVRTAAQLAAGADSFTCRGAVFVRETMAADVVAGMLESGFETWASSLPQEPPPGPGQRWLDHGTPTLTPAVSS